MDLGFAAARALADSMTRHAAGAQNQSCHLGLDGPAVDEQQTVFDKGAVSSPFAAEAAELDCWCGLALKDLAAYSRLEKVRHLRDAAVIQLRMPEPWGNALVALTCPPLRAWLCS